MIKRGIDLVMAVAALVLLMPVFAVVALLIKFDSEGPIFFRQERIGRGFRPFLIYKFRTMVNSAPQLGPTITVGADVRITRIGCVLRRTKIDELPQLINVLKGEMSLVGPRPEIAKYVEAFRGQYQEILSVRPGITDLASLKFIDEASLLARASDPERTYRECVLPQKLALARQYVRERSFRMDAVLLGRTFCGLFRRS
jgi:lipopolysaccharide/colanic/teichoic acid biosynthesis glycosyltransferase